MACQRGAYACTIAVFLARQISPMTPITTERLTLRPITRDDAGFIVQLLNSPAGCSLLATKKSPQ